MSVRILRVGDSHTAALASFGHMAAQLGDSAVWVGSQTSGDGPHEGHVGWSIKQISDNLDGWLDSSKPDLVTLIIGTNDAAGDRDPYAMSEDVKSIIHRIGARGISVVLGTIPPYPAKASIQAAYNEDLRAAVPELANSGIDIYLADIDKAVTTDDLLADKIHLSAGGNIKAGAIVVNAIRQAMAGSNRLSASLPRGALAYLSGVPFWKKAAAGLLALAGIYLFTREP